MTVILNAPLTETFAGVPFLGANGVSTSGAASPTGIGSQLSIVDGWMRSVVNRSDADTSGGKRSEIAGNTETVPGDRLYRWEFRLGAGWVYDPTQFVLMQIHSTPDVGVVAENFWITCDGALFRAFIPAIDPPGEGAFQKQIASWPVSQDVQKIALLVRWSQTGGGSIALIVGNTVRANIRGNGTSYNHTLGPYLKLGAYMPSSGYAGWTSREMFARNLIVTDDLDGKSWTELIGDIPRPVPFSVQL